MISSNRDKQSVSYMAISAKEMPKNHTDKERFAPASSSDLIFTFSAQTTAF